MLKPVIVCCYEAITGFFIKRLWETCFDKFGINYKYEALLGNWKPALRYQK